MKNRIIKKPRIEAAEARKLAGCCRKNNTPGMNSTEALWKQFMPRCKEIKNRVGSDLISMRVFHQTSKEPLTRHTPFDEWAAVEVSDAIRIPDGMESYLVPEGLYAVFIHHGLPSEAPRTMQHIFGIWLPNSEYKLDNRPHLAIMGPNYRPDDPQAKEEIWIPVVRP